MSSNPVFKKVLLKNIEVQFPKLDRTHRWNSDEQRSEPCAQTAANASWSIGWTMSHEDAKALFDELKEHYNACKALDPKLPKFTKVFGMRKLDNGLVAFSAKKNGVTRKGDPSKAPIVIGMDREALSDADRAIWGGSTCTVRAQAFPTKDPNGDGGISLLLDAVQVVEGVYGGGGADMDDFDIKPKAAPEEDLDPFGLPETNAAPASPAGGFSVMDDEIPFAPEWRI
jgi:hypothetical protein